MKRSKRLGFHHHVGLPTARERKKLLNLFTKDVVGFSAATIQELVEKTDDMTGADIREMISLMMEQAILRPENDPKHKNKKIKVSAEDIKRGLKIRNKYKITK